MPSQVFTKQIAGVTYQILENELISGGAEVAIVVNGQPVVSVTIQKSKRGGKIVVKPEVGEGVVIEAGTKDSDAPGLSDALLGPSLDDVKPETKHPFTSKIKE